MTVFAWLRRLAWLPRETQDARYQQIISRLDRLSGSVAMLHNQGRKMANDIETLEATLTALESKVAESSATLTALATTVLDLRDLIGNTAQLEAAVTHAAARAEKMLNALAAAEDAADDALPPTGPVNPA